MSLKGKPRISLLVFICAAGLTAAFNSERKSSGDALSIQPHHGQHKETKDALIVPATPEDETQKKTRIRRARQRHERNRREKEDEEAIREIFSKPQIDPNSIPNTDGYNSNSNRPSASYSSSNVFSSNSNGYGSNGYSYEPPQQPFLPPMQPYFQTPQSYVGPQYLPSAAPSHNTIIPNGNQVNNYYPSQFPTYTPASNPWSGVPNYFPAPFYFGPFLIIPIPICYPNNNNNNNNNNDNNSNNDINNQPEIVPTLEPVVPTGIGNRLGDTFDFSKYYNTTTGVDLKPIAPGREPSVTQPPALHISGENVNNQVDQQVPPQQNRPQPTQRPPQRTTQRPTQRTTQRTAQRPMQQQPQRPGQLRPFPQIPPVSRPSPQRPPLVPAIEGPPQSLDGLGSDNSLAEKCIWAIVRCCNQVPRPVSVPRCFEMYGCSGAFFDNPCNSEIAMSVSRTANEIEQNSFLFS